MAVILSTLECPVCYELIWPPKKIFQCSKGHILCEGCMTHASFDQVCVIGTVIFILIKPQVSLKALSKLSRKFLASRDQSKPRARKLVCQHFGVRPRQPSRSCSGPGSDARGCSGWPGSQHAIAYARRIFFQIFAISPSP